MNWMILTYPILNKITKATVKSGFFYLHISNKILKLIHECM